MATHAPAKIDVLMATFNGSRFLREQIESVLAQTDVDLRLRVRDDGSEDDTVAILESYEKSHPGRVVLVRDDLGRLGVGMNFLHLLSLESDADFFAFCDQDDVWQRNKLITAVRRLQDIAGPALYFSALEFVTESLDHMALSPQTITPSFEGALVEGLMSGCTALINRSLKLLISRELPRRATIHDWWVYLVACTFGTVVFDPVPLIRYRQHAANVIGGGHGAAYRWKRHFLRLFSGSYWRIANQIAELLRLFGEHMTPAQRQLATDLLTGKHNLATRLRIAVDPRIRAQTPVGTLGIKALILLNKY